MFGRTQGKAPLVADPYANLRHPVGSQVILRPSIHPPLSSLPKAPDVPPDGTKGHVIAFSGDEDRVVEIVDGPQAGRRLVFEASALSAT
jgi:hypothetical protein